jgi:hypothetical protein
MNTTYEEQYLNSLFSLSERQTKKRKINYSDDIDDDLNNNKLNNNNLGQKITLNHSEVFETTKTTLTKISNNYYELKYNILPDNKILNNIKFININPNRKFIILLMETDNFYVKIIIPPILKKLNIKQITNYKIENNEFKLYFNFNELLYPKFIKNTCLIYSSIKNSKVTMNLCELYNINFIDIINNKILIKYYLNENVLINMFMTLPKIININNFNKYEIKENKFIMYFDN